MNAPADFTLLKSRQMAAWASGDYAVIGITLQIVGEQLAEGCDLQCDEPRNGSWRRQSSPSGCCAGRFRSAVGHPFGTAPQFQQSAAKPRQCLLSAVWHSRQLRFLV